ncbi:replication initiation and membrane attachment family protein [Halobacillus mangrovi]|uniref:Helicase DnaB n=1 Tax=Halobacillus mangrovi TaxID=402384 RepID=A0A1W5ZUA7_9BACI|nr:DnaD domain protein [Halobacillus mangrovi]ARI76837.1 helicase DnaB [Halobacillus mangrovi]
MNHTVGKLLPVDGFRILKCGALPTNAHHSLTHLYQPIIGRLAVSLYQVLVSESELTDVQSVQSHHTLMTYLSAPLDKVYDARRKLEAIGLVSTFKKSDEDQQSIYLYKVYPPFSPNEFFMDDMLSLLLFHELGEDKYQQIKERLTTEYVSTDDYEEVTVSFDEVFHSTFTEGIPPEVQPKRENLKDRKERGPVLNFSRVDFDWLHQSLKNRMYPSERILTGPNKKLIAQLASLYNLTTLELEKAVTWAVDENHQLVAEELKAACHDFMKEKPSKGQTNLLDQRQKVKETSDSIAQSKGEQFVDMLEQISPRELLEDLSGGNRASDQDLKLIRDVMTEQGLAPGVMNVLVHYVLLKTDMKLSKAYLEKIASHWTRKNVTTVRQAMNLAKAEHQKYQQWGKQKSQKRSKKEEVIPAWFNEQKKASSEEPAIEKPVDTSDIAERIKRLTNKEN